MRCGPMMTTFLSWNLNGKPLQDLVANLARSRDVDVVILLECEIGVTDLLQSLNPPGSRSIFHYAVNPAQTPLEAIKLFTLFSSDFLLPLEDELGLTIRGPGPEPQVFFR